MCHFQQQSLQSPRISVKAQEAFWTGQNDQGQDWVGIGE
jgi:hypothetical protein